MCALSALLISPPSTAQPLAAGYAHTCALGGSGRLTCWGANDSGQLGDGTTTNRPRPTEPVGVLSIGTTAVTAGNAHTCAVVFGGVSGSMLKCWGLNQAGQLGDGTLTNRLTAVSVSGLGPGVRAVSAGATHTCAITSQGTVMCWGNNLWGQLGNGTRVNSSTPVPVMGIPEGAIAIATGEQHSCAVTSASVLKCWGSNGDSQILGFNDLSTGLHLTPIVVAGLDQNIVDVTAGARHTCAKTSAGAMRCLGNNTQGQLGNGSFITGVSASQVIGFASGTLSMQGAETHTCAVLAQPQMGSGAAQCWGNNGNSQLGIFNDLSTTKYPQPYDVIGQSSGITHVAGGHAHSCAIDSFRQVQCWGNNSQGQLGDGTTNTRITATPVVP
jgi:alpha-tubulin suppressor-like RCC1 family protein